MNKNNAKAMRNNTPPTTPPMIGPILVFEDEVPEAEADCDGMETVLLVFE